MDIIRPYAAPETPRKQSGQALRPCEGNHQVQTHDAAMPALPADAGAALRAAGTADPWQLVRRSHERKDFAQDESLFALANGSLGVRGGLEEDESTEALNETLSTMFFVFTGMGVVVYAAALVVAYFLPAIFHLDAEQARLGQIVFLIVAANIALQFVFSVFGGIINGFELYYLNNVVSVVFNVGAALVNLLVLWLGYGLVTLVTATTLMRAVPVTASPGRRPGSAPPTPRWRRRSPRDGPGRASSR